MTARIKEAIERELADRASYQSMSPQTRRAFVEENLRLKRGPSPKPPLSPSQFLLLGQLNALQQARDWEVDEKHLARVLDPGVQERVQRFGDELASHLVFLKNARLAVDADYGRRSELPALDAQISTLASRIAAWESASDLERHATYHADLDARTEPAAMAERMRLHGFGAEAERKRIAALPESARRADQRQPTTTNTSNEGSNS